METSLGEKHIYSFELRLVRWQMTAMTVLLISKMVVFDLNVEISDFIVLENKGSYSCINAPFF